MRAATQRAVTFQSTPSLRRATRHHSGGADQAGVSIHALLAESDWEAISTGSALTSFNPRPPCGERLSFSVKWEKNGVFQSTPSLRRATVRKRLHLNSQYVSIHALLAESDVWGGGNGNPVFCFNPRPPCGERLFSDSEQIPVNRFQSTPSLRRATC